MSTVGPAARVCLDLGPERPWERQKTKDRHPALSLSLFLTRLTTGTRRPRRGEDSPSDQTDDRVETKSVTDRLTRIHSLLCHHVRQLDEEGRKITSREEDKMINYLSAVFKWRPLNLLKWWYYSLVLPTTVFPTRLPASKFVIETTCLVVLLKIKRYFLDISVLFRKRR